MDYILLSKQLGDLSVADAIRLYFEKYDAIKRGDFALLAQLKNDHPVLFQEKALQEIQSIISYVVSLQKNRDFQKRYEMFCREKAKEKFTLI